MTLNEYIDCLSHLSVNKKGTHVAPHKAVLLLTVFDLIKKGEIDSQFIPITKSLEKAFELTWNDLVGSHSHFSCALNYPFQHMSSSPFWTLVKLPSYEFKKEYSMSALKKNFAGAIINEDLFQLIKDETSRAKMEQVLIQTYLSPNDFPQCTAGSVLSTLAILLLTVA
ncbi:MAG: hypothetical protein JFR38_09255 [Muribaculaceae bacterium]|nr:hypothetical protein [Muribaculaceae bacterium]